MGILRLCHICDMVVTVAALNIVNLAKSGIWNF